jgi:Holliday junction resolvasome RuvABC DNA-binding subunit
MAGGARATQSIAPATAWRREPSQVEALGSTFVALRGLGFREGEIRRSQAEVLNSSPGDEGNIERLLRATLAKLTSSRGSEV